MSATMEQIHQILNAVKPQYSDAAKLGANALPHLEILIKNAAADPLLASQAAYMAGLIQDERSVSVLMTASRSMFPQVRIAAANGSRHLNLPAADNILNLLKNDQDRAVRKRALRSIESRRNDGG